MADINTPKEYLEEALQLIDSLGADETALKSDTDKADTLNKEFAALKKNIEKEKERTVTTRRDDVERSFDKQIKEKDSELSDAEKKRSKAREEGVNNRVTLQTAGLKGEIANLKANLSHYCELNKLPWICKTKLFYGLYYPSGLGDWIRLIIIMLLFAAAMVAAFMYGELPTFIVTLVIVLVIVVLFVGTGARIKGKYAEQLSHCREIITNIRNNEQGVKNVTRNILDDESDAAYDLSQFDADISARKKELEQLMSDKLSALTRFDAETRQQLISEIDANYGERLKTAEDAYNEAMRQAEATRQKVSEVKNRLNSEFVQYIGSKNMTHEAVSRMIELIAGGEAVSVSDAAAKLNETGSAVK